MEGEKQMKDMNKIWINGTITGIHQSQKVTTIALASDGGTGYAQVYPLITFYNKDLCKGLEIKTRVEVEASFSIRRVIDKETGEPTYLREIIGQDINRTKRELAKYVYIPEEDAYNGGFPRDENYGIFAGKVSHLYHPNDNVSIVTIHANNGKYTDVIEIGCFSRQAQYARTLEVGDQIAVSAVLRTREREYRDTPHYHSLVCKDIYKPD